jgi:lipopolysaccharide export system protein LptA
MSINLFFFLTLAFLLGMYGYFTPEYNATQVGKEVPKIELSDFTLYEISHQGVDHILEGKEGKKFEQYYEVTSAKFSDNTDALFQTIQSDQADYRNDVISLEGNVHYVREDGLEFRSNKGSYDSNASLVKFPGSFTITQNANRINGEHLLYNTKLESVSANRIHASYQLK